MIFVKRLGRIKKEIKELTDLKNAKTELAIAEASWFDIISFH